ncbi:hypothetical protein I8J29_09420 [Paenibacillus sp. MWE-103]|uniref:DUF2178 domain-containing protein n=1 Tax=Paenibacillus artemisiicola TaxID=1172618 RepID=A0ABS3W807_9BACL|nr:hypothetical protein [Paenibacillus artemisiicola]MBO7744413.1 hypothetical protein [Paenibacillus artemisiicola]
MNKIIWAYFLTLSGVVLFAGGLFFIKTIDDPYGMLRALPYVCVGVGCVIFGHGIGEIILRSAMKNNPAAAKQLEIDTNDERHLTIANRAKAKAYDMTVFVFAALILSLSLMGLDLSAILLLIFAYLFILVYNSYYRLKYYKEM